MITCWAAKGGVGTTTVVAGMALAIAEAAPVLAVDLAGDLGLAFGGMVGDGPGVAEWTRAGAAVPADALDRLAEPVRGGLRLVPRGRGPFDLARLGVLATLLAGLDEQVVVDAGQIGASDGSVVWSGAIFVELAGASLLVTRACPVAQAHLATAALAGGPTGVVVVRDPGRGLSRRAIAAVAGAPVVAELDLDPAVGAAVDGGLARAALPGPYLRALAAVAGAASEVARP